MPLSIEIFDASVQRYLNADAALSTLSSSFRFAEGPVWNKAGFYLVSDIPANVIYALHEGVEQKIYLAESGYNGASQRALSEQTGSNGLAYDGYDNLLICQHGNGSIALYDGTFLKPHIASYQSKPFNSPNDIVVHNDGTIFFSDPPYGLKDQQLQPAHGQNKACVYAYRNGSLKLVTDRYQFPNGVCLSPDQQFLYTISNKPFEAFLLEWNVKDFSFSREVAKENGDGIKTDAHHNFYLCTKNGVLILDNKGQKLALVKMPKVPANCCFGGHSGKDFCIAAREDVYLIKDFLK